MAQENKIRDTRNGDWLWVYNALIADPHLTPVDKNVYAGLASFAGYDKVNPSFEQIAKSGAVSRRAVALSIKKLVKCGYLSFEKGIGRGNPNEYFLLKKTKGCNLCTNSQVEERVQTTTIKGANDDKEKVQPLHSLKIENKDNIKILAKANSENAVYGNQDVNKVIESLKAEFELPTLDGSAAENRKYAWLAIKKCKSVNGVLKIIALAAADDFYGDKISNVKKLYYHMVEIVQKARGMKKEVKNKVAPAYNANTKNN